MIWMINQQLLQLLRWRGLLREGCNAGGEGLLAKVKDLGLRRHKSEFCPARRHGQGNVRTLFTLRLPSESGRCAAALFSQDALKGPLRSS